jgi:hypothetical protein
VQTAFQGIRIHNGADGPESQIDALYRILTGEGGTYRMGSFTYEMTRTASACIEGTWGGACFRPEAMPVIVHFTDICSHNGPAGDFELFCSPYAGLSPAPPTFDETAAVMAMRGAKYIGVNTSGYTCRGLTPPSMYAPGTPCTFMREIMRRTGSEELDGTPLLYDLQNGGSSDEAFTSLIAGALETLATRVPFDVDTLARDDAGEPEAVDATRFIASAVPACRASPATDPCWTEPAGYAHDEAVSALDDTTFARVVPGTRVRFRVTFRNDFYEGDARVHVFVAYLDVRADRGAVLDTRQVFIVVPASSGGFF